MWYSKGDTAHSRVFSGIVSLAPRNGKPCSQVIYKWVKQFMKTWDEAFKFEIWSRRCWNQIIQLENRWDGKNVRQAACDGVPSRKEIYMYLQLIGGKCFYYTCVGCVFRGLTDESEIIKFLQHGTLVGLLPVPHPILIRKYQVKISSVMLLKMFKDYLQNFTIFFFFF